MRGSIGDSKDARWERHGVAVPGTELAVSVYTALDVRDDASATVSPSRGGTLDMGRIFAWLIGHKVLRVGPVALASAIFLLLASPAAPITATPPIPHPVEGRQDCLLCHETANAPPSNHVDYGNDSCSGCHSVVVAQPTASPSSSSGTASAGAFNGSDGLCLACHQNESLSMRLAAGDTLSLYVDEGKYRQSVHGQRLKCADCHTNITGYPHPQMPYVDRRAFSTAYYEACKRCHFANYTKTLDSVHFTALSSGERAAPVCTDCHGAHEVAQPAAPRSTISQACGTCHTSVYSDYAESVHSQALVGEDNPDVPVCTTCHGVHSIGGARSVSFRLASTELCASCHEDSQLMSKYGLSANVLKTYLEDFHGRTVGFYQRQEAASQPSEPLCVDCHGIHNIKSTKDPTSPVIQANLQSTCQKCHADASPSFPSAWLGHYEPSPQKAPLVYYIRLYYWVLIPVMIGGLTLHIGLDLWRLARNR